MGGDAAPAPVVAGAVSAARDCAIDVELVGPRDWLEHEIAAHGPVDGAHVTLVEAPAAVGMADPPLAALRRNRPTSIRVAVERVRDGHAAALFSAGHTGATVMAACTGLGLVEGVDWPALAVTVPTARGAAVMLDVGATIDCRPEHLLQFAAMGCAYASVALQQPEPAVGLLSIGEEAQKGNELTRDAFRLLESSGLRFTGNLEARDVFTGKADVIVCDGFTGNVALKVSEGLVAAVEAMLEAELARYAGGAARRRARARRVPPVPRPPRLHGVRRCATARRSRPVRRRTRELVAEGREKRHRAGPTLGPGRSRRAAGRTGRRARRGACLKGPAIESCWRACFRARARRRWAWAARSRPSMPSCERRSAKPMRRSASRSAASASRDRNRS